MNYKIEDKPAFTVVGVKEFTSTVDGVNFKNIPAMWQRLPGQTAQTLLALANSQPAGIIGVCGDMHDDGFDYWIAAATTKPCPPGFESMQVPAATWAMFECAGPLPGALQELFRRIFAEWLPTSGYEHAPLPEIEWYSDGDQQAEDYISGVWLPIVKKES